jgi:RNA polymerase sigma factor (TIGR02999 family)
MASTAADPGGLPAELSAAVYAELRGVAARYLRNERRNHTLRTTDLAHEAYLRLAAAGLTDRPQLAFRAVAAQVIRHILVDHARRRARARRARAEPVPLRLESAPLVQAPSLDLLDLDGALCRLEQLSERQARVVELRFFGGLSEEETAETLGLARRTVQKDWRGARAWLERELSGRETSAPVGGDPSPPRNEGAAGPRESRSGV